MHNNILTVKQLELQPYISKFKRSFYFVGGTAIALHIGHRRSIDFDLFTISTLNRSKIKKELLKFPFDQLVIFEDCDQLHLIINQVKVTFFSYPYEVSHPITTDFQVSMPTLLSLAAMKAFALGRRAKWKDYVDLYFILRDSYTIPEICDEARNIFKGQFSEKLFREQLAFHKDIDYSEVVDYLVKPASDNDIKSFLIDEATNLFS